MEEINALNTDLKIIDPNVDKRYVKRYFEETYLDIKNEIEKEGLPSNGRAIIERLKQKLPEWLPGYTYIAHSLNLDGGIVIEIYLKHT